MLCCRTLLFAIAAIGLFLAPGSWAQDKFEAECDGQTQWRAFPKDGDIFSGNCRRWYLPQYEARIFCKNEPERCAAAHVQYVVMVMDTDMIGPLPLAGPEHFFNTEAYPGKRVLVRGARYIPEWILMAAGVPHSQIYAALSSTRGLDYVQKVLTSLKDSIVWVDDFDQAHEALLNKSARFGMLRVSDLQKNNRNGALDMFDAGTLRETMRWVAQNPSSLRGQMSNKTEANVVLKGFGMDQKWYHHTTAHRNPLQEIWEKPSSK